MFHVGGVELAWILGVDCQGRWNTLYNHWSRATHFDNIVALLLEEFCGFPDDPHAARMGVEVAGLGEDSDFEPPKKVALSRNLVLLFLAQYCTSVSVSANLLENFSLSKGRGTIVASWFFLPRPQ